MQKIINKIMEPHPNAAVAGACASEAACTSTKISYVLCQREESSCSG